MPNVKIAVCAGIPERRPAGLKTRPGGRVLGLDQV
jgi:hypothetical protein